MYIIHLFSRRQILEIYDLVHKTIDIWCDFLHRFLDVFYWMNIMMNFWSILNTFCLKIQIFAVELLFESMTQGHCVINYISAFWKCFRKNLWIENFLCDHSIWNLNYCPWDWKNRMSRLDLILHKKPYSNLLLMSYC